MTRLLLTGIKAGLIYLACVSFLLFLLLPLWCGAGTYHVSPLGSNTSPYDTWAKAANLPSTVVTAGNDVSGPHLMYVAPYEYAGSLNFANTNWDNGVIQGTSAHGSTTAAIRGQVIINSSAAAATLALNDVAGITINNIGLTNSSAQNLIDTTNATGTLNELYLYDSQGRVLNIAGTSNIVTNKCRYAGAKQNGSLFRTTESSSWTSNFDVFSHSTNNYLGGGASAITIYNAGSGTLTVNNGDISGSMGIPIASEGTGVTNITNSIVDGSLTENKYTVLRSSGTVNLIDNILGINHGTGHYLISGTINTDTGNLKTTQPRYRHRQRSAIIVPTFDDSINAAYVQSLEPVFSSRGKSATWFVNGFHLSESADIMAIAQSVHSNGIFELQSHGWSHAVVTLSGDTFSLTKAGATFDVNRTADTITVGGDGGGVVEGFKAKYFSDIKAELQALGVTVGAYATGVYGPMFGESLADSSGAQASPYTPQLLLDATCNSGFYKSELKDSKAYLESIFAGSSFDYFAVPNGTSTTDTEAIIKTCGYSANRKVGVDYSNLLSSINVFKLRAISMASYVTDSATADETTVKSRVRALCNYAADTGSILFFLAHNALGDALAEATPQQWGWVLDTVAEYPEIQVMNMSQAVARIEATETTVDDITYTRTWTDQSDYRLRAGSPAINAGTSTSTGTVTLANSRLSLVAGTAFVDFSSAGTLTPYLGGRLTVTDSAGKKATGYLKAAGTGETLSETELIVDGGFADGSKWTCDSGWSVAGGKAVKVSDAAGRNITSTTAVSYVAGGLFKGVFDIDAVSGGYLGLRLGGTNTSFASVYNTTGTKTGYAVSKSSGAVLSIVNMSAASGTGTIDNVSIKQVLAPSVTGATITSTRGGTTYNWESVEAGFNYNDASGYSYILSRRHINTLDLGYRRDQSYKQGNY